MIEVRGGLANTAAAAVVVFLLYYEVPAGIRMYLAYDAWISRPPDRSIAVSLQYIYKTPSTLASPHTRSTMS